MKKARDRIKQAWEENPLTCIAVGAMAATAAAKLLQAVTEAKKAQTWEKEVERRRMSM